LRQLRERTSLDTRPKSFRWFSRIKTRQDALQAVKSTSNVLFGVAAIMLIVGILLANISVDILRYSNASVTNLYADMLFNAAVYAGLACPYVGG
jgi:hypothetical protein